MNIFEKIFQRNDKFFLLIYYLFLGLSLYLSSTIAYYIRNQNWNLPEIIYSRFNFNYINFFS